MSSPALDPTPQELLAEAVTALGGVERTGQVAMAGAVDQAMRESRHLLVQAGTGTGKSLAYLVPALLQSLRTDKPVIVATATLALQSQLVERDLPLLASALSDVLDEPPTFATLKGRANYACLHRVRDGVPDDSGTLVTHAALGPMGQDVLRARDWAQEQAAEQGSGEREHLQPGVSDRVWQQVSVTSRECLGATKCPYNSECFAEKSRGRASKVNIVVTNHALLAIDAIDNIPVLPEHDTVVVDEGHELVARVTGAATKELSSTAIERVVRRVRTRLELDLYEDLLEAVESLRVGMAGTDPGLLNRVSEGLTVGLAAVHSSSRLAMSALQADKSNRTLEIEAAHRQAVGMLEELFTTSGRILAALSVSSGPQAGGTAGADVVWLSEGERGARSISVAPLSVGRLLAATLFAKNTVVMTSATLTLGGEFDLVAASVGLRREVTGTPAGDGSDTDDPPAMSRPWSGVDVGSPFNYPAQGILYIASHLERPGREGPSSALLEEVADLVLAAGGRTLGLFSSRRGAESAAEHVRARMAQLPLAEQRTVLCQGEDLVPSLVRAFAADPSTSLFGTLSLWQGVDVPGTSCQLVIIDRIPFPRPDDPLSSARARAVERAGGSGFMSVSVAHAALLLAQGAGRLIRSDHDRGVVAVLDSRLGSARYSSFLRRSMPPLWLTRDRDLVLGALGRLHESALSIEDPSDSA